LTAAHLSGYGVNEKLGTLPAEYSRKDLPEIHHDL